MSKDIVVVVNIDAQPKPADDLGILIVSTIGEKPIKTYRSLEEVAVDYDEASVAYQKVAALFNQGKTTLADKLIRKVKIGGIVEPTDATDLVAKIEALRKQDDDWYILLTDVTEDAYITALAAWAEASEPTEAELGKGVEDHRKLYFAQTDNKSLAVANRRSIIIYTEDLEEEADAAYLGNVGPFYPQAVTWKFKRPDGLNLPALTDAERDALEEANVNFLTEEYKRQYVKNGVCADGEFIDVQLGADWIARNMRVGLYEVFLSNGKIPYTDLGFALVANAVFATLNQAVDLGIIARDPDSSSGIFMVVVPKRSDATEEQVRARRMPDILWEAELEGAVHSIKVTGTLAATLSS